MPHYLLNALIYTGNGNKFENYRRDFIALLF